jgi:hypothetical protein
MGTNNDQLNINHVIAFYGSKGHMAVALNITGSKLTALLKNRRKLLMYLPEIKAHTRLSADDLLQMILNDE